MPAFYSPFPHMAEKAVPVVPHATVSVSVAEHPPALCLLHQQQRQHQRQKTDDGALHGRFSLLLVRVSVGLMNCAALSPAGLS